MEQSVESWAHLEEKLEALEESKNDYLIQSSASKMVGGDFYIPTIGMFNPTTLFHRQLAEKLKIPMAYYDYVSNIKPEDGAISLRDINVNGLLKAEPGKHLVRTIDKTARAFLSDGYKPIDHFPVVTESIWPVLKESPYEFQLHSANVTDNRMYIQIIFPTMEFEVKKVGDKLKVMLTITNSEVGLGALDIRLSSLILRCMNGAILESVIRTIHIGSRINDDNVNVYKNDTIMAELKSYRLRARDSLSFALDRGRLEASIAKKFDDAVEDQVSIEKVNVLAENVTKRFALPVDAKDKMIADLHQHGRNRYQLVQSVTAMAHGEGNADRQYDYEKAGGSLLRINQGDWLGLMVEQQRKRRANA